MLYISSGNLCHIVAWNNYKNCDSTGVKEKSKEKGVGSMTSEILKNFICSISHYSSNISNACLLRAGKREA